MGFAVETPLQPFMGRKERRRSSAGKLFLGGTTKGSGFHARVTFPNSASEFDPHRGLTSSLFRLPQTTAICAQAL